MLQEWWGINEDIKEKAMTFHQKGGCRVFIPDIYKGKTTVEVAEAKHVSLCSASLTCCCPAVFCILLVVNLCSALSGHQYLASAATHLSTAVPIHFTYLQPNIKVHGAMCWCHMQQQSRALHCFYVFCLFNSISRCMVLSCRCMTA